MRKLSVFFITSSYQVFGFRWEVGIMDNKLKRLFNSFASEPKACVKTIGFLHIGRNHCETEDAIFWFREKQIPLQIIYTNEWRKDPTILVLCSGTTYGTESTKEKPVLLNFDDCDFIVILEDKENIVFEICGQRVSLKDFDPTKKVTLSPIAGKVLLHIADIYETI